LANDDLRIAETKDLFNYQNKKSEVRSTKTAHPWLAAMKPVFADEKVKKYGHNMKFDIEVMHTASLEVCGADFDTMIASYLLNPGTRQHNLDAVTFTELNFEKISKDDLLGAGKDKIAFNAVATEKLALYSCEDADFTNRLVSKLSKQLKEQKMIGLFRQIEMPLISVLAEMEENGVKLDEEFLKIMSRKLAKSLKTIEKKIHMLAGTDFNINSTKQLKEILFEKLEIPADLVAKTKTGLSTAADELLKLKDFHPIIPQLLEYRELSKLSSTYVNALPLLVNKKTGRLHTSFNQTIAATGRLSSTEPNLQNIPVRTELGREIRKAFTAEKGYKLLSLDYSQIELRLAAHMSDDKKMIAAFKRGDDIHTATAAEINRVKPEDVTREMRREAKAVNFGILYGQGPHGLSQSADIPYARAKEFIDKYFAIYGGIKEFIERSISEARESGYAETMLGRRRNLPEINSSVVQVRKAAERMAVNTPLQGTAADMIKSAMIAVHELIEKKYARDKSVRLILQVHDELLLEVKAGAIAPAAAEIKKIMEEAVALKVPVIVDVSSGDNWGEMEAIEVRSKK